MTPNDERAQIRAEAIEECLAALPPYHATIATLNSLLRPDPAEASEPLQSAPSANAPADHGPRAAAHGEAGGWSPDERTVQECIEILLLFADDPQSPPDKYGEAFDAGIHFACEDLTKLFQAMLPKPDPAKEIVAAFDLESKDGLGLPEFMTDEQRVACEALTRHLIDTGRLRT